MLKKIKDLPNGTKFKMDRCEGYKLFDGAMGTRVLITKAWTTSKEDPPQTGSFIWSEDAKVSVLQQPT